MRTIVAAMAFVGYAAGAKIFYAPGCNTNMNDMNNIDAWLRTDTDSGVTPSGWALANNIPISANFPAGPTYSIGELELPDGMEIELQDGSEIEIIEGANGTVANITAGQWSRPSCDITCHTNFRDGMPDDAMGDLDNLTVSSTPFNITEDIIFPAGTGYTLEAYGALVIGTSLWWKGADVTVGDGSVMIPCLEITPCSASSPPLRTAVGDASVTGPIWSSFYGPDSRMEITSCPATQTINPANPSTLNLDSDTLTQMDMRRIGTIVSASGRLTALRSQDAGLQQSCTQTGDACPTNFTSVGNVLVVDVTGMRPLADLAVMTQMSQRTALLEYLTTGVASAAGEIDSLSIQDATFGPSTGNRLRLTLMFNLPDPATGPTLDDVAESLQRVVDELIGSFSIPWIDTCSTLVGDVDYSCVTSAVQVAFTDGYDGVNTMTQLMTILENAYATARGCDINDLTVGNCTTYNRVEGSYLREGEITYRDSVIQGILNSGTTAAPTASPTQSPTVTQADASSNVITDATGISVMYLIIIAVCIVLILGFIILRSGKKKQEPAGKGHAEMAFDNPMYDDGQVAKTNPMAGAEDSGSLYDEPAMAPGDDNDAMYDEAPGNGGYLDVAQPKNDGGYLDVDDEADEGGDGDEDEEDEAEEDAEQEAEQEAEEDGDEGGDEDGEEEVEDGEEDEDEDEDDGDM